MPHMTTDTAVTNDRASSELCAVSKVYRRTTTICCQTRYKNYTYCYLYHQHPESEDTAIVFYITTLSLVRSVL